jgi:hypothetical protein
MPASSMPLVGVLAAAGEIARAAASTPPAICADMAMRPKPARKAARDAGVRR